MGDTVTNQGLDCSLLRPLHMASSLSVHQCSGHQGRILNLQRATEASSKAAQNEAKRRIHAGNEKVGGDGGGWQCH